MLGLARFVTHGSGGSGPSLNFNFADDSPYLSQQITFTRASAGTFTGANGLIQNAPVNLLTYSEQFDNAAWIKTASSIAANTIVSPDGTVNGDKLVEDTSNASHLITRSIGVTSGTVYTYTLYAKAAERTIIRFAFGLALPSVACTVSLVDGSVSDGTPTVQSVGNGWWRISLTATATSTGNAEIYTAPRITTGGGSSAYTGNGTSGIFIWGAQLVEGSVAGPYARTVASTSGAPRFDYDPVTLAAKGLLIEEQRTNLLTYSEQFDNAAWTKFTSSITATNGLDPAGGNSADRWVSNAGSTTHYLGQPYTNTPGATFTFSGWVRSATGDNQTFSVFVASTINVGNLTATNQWQRFSVSGSSTFVGSLVAGFTRDSSNNPVDLWVWGAQLEAGSFATSYIPTVASQVTRSADVALVNTLSPWYNATEGTLYTDAALYGYGSASMIAAFTSGSTNIIQHFYNSATSLRYSSVDASVLQAELTQSGLSLNTAYKMASAFKLNDFAVSVNGGAVLTDTSGTVPSVTTLGIGNRNSLLFFNGHIRRITYYPRRLPNATLQQITS